MKKHNVLQSTHERSWRPLTLLLLFLATATLAHAAWDIRERKWDKDEFWLLGVEEAPDWGYYALGDYRRRVPDPSSGPQHYKEVYTQALQRLDDDFQVVWEKKFTEYKYWQYEKILMNDGHVYLGGSKVGASENLDARLSCFDLDGDLLWERVYKLNGCTETKGLKLSQIKDGSGDMLAITSPWECTNRFAMCIHVRLRPNGDIVWQKPFIVSKYKWHGGGPGVYLANGSLLSIGFAYPSMKIVENLPYKIWIRRTNMRTGEMVWEKLLDAPCNQIEWIGIELLENGQVMTSGIYEDHSTGRVERKAVIGYFTQTGELLDLKVWQPATQTEMAALNHADDGTYYTTAECRDFDAEGRDKARYTLFYNFDQQMNIIDEVRIDTKVCGYVRQRRDGGLVVINGDGLLFLDRI